MFIHPLPPEIVDELRAVLSKACVRLEAVDDPGGDASLGEWAAREGQAAKGDPIPGRFCGRLTSSTRQ